MPSVPEDLDPRVLEQELDTYLSNCDVVDAAIIATLDGRLRAQQQRGAFEVERAAVMGSSLMALGDTITAELGIGACEVVIAESQYGLVLFNHVQGVCVLISVTKSKNGLGALLSWARRTAEDIARKHFTSHRVTA
ncbi:roadblock/LC7 domain-containing protein [Nitrospira sp. NS4]|uniref:roadblock/LC7 domain-containing protein n=1 Tax=Nitrospira sp. NS4 TaxID=3414498 RepID=UPI003C2E2653